MRGLRSTLAVVTSLFLLSGCPSLTEPGDPIIIADPPVPAIAAVGTVARPQVSASATISAAPPPPAPKPPAPPEAKPDGEQIQASHILVSWKGCTRSTQTRTKDEAKKRIDEVVAKMKKGGDFAKLAGEYGEDGTKTKGGDLGPFGHGMMIKPFEDAAFALKVGQVSDIVETPFGYHLIKRTK